MKKNILTHLLLSLFFCLFASKSFASINLEQGIIRGVTFDQETKKAAKKDEGFRSNFSNSLISTLNFNQNYQSSDSQNNYKELVYSARLNSALNFHKNFSIYSAIRLSDLSPDSEETGSNNISRNRRENQKRIRNFKNEGIFAEEFALAFNQEKYNLIAGKFNLNFGTAWRWDRDIWGHNIAREYTQTEKLGFSGIYRIGDIKKTGLYNFGFSIFTNDSKNFDNSLLTNRNSPSKQNALPGDTRSLKSYLASLDVNYDFGKKGDLPEELSYHFSYLNLAMNKTANLDHSKRSEQKSYALAMNYKYPFSPRFSLDSLLEYARIKNTLGDPSFGDSYLTGNFIGRFDKNWNATISLVNHKTSVFRQSSVDNNLLEFSGGYEFGKNRFFDRLLLQAGYRKIAINNRLNYDKRNAYGLMMRYYKSF